VAPASGAAYALEAASIAMAAVPAINPIFPIRQIPLDGSRNFARLLNRREPLQDHECYVSIL
jgi:hypothetical protein